MEIVFQKFFAIYTSIKEVGTKTLAELDERIAEKVKCKPLIYVVEVSFAFGIWMRFKVLLPPTNVEFYHFRVLFKFSQSKPF